MHPFVRPAIIASSILSAFAVHAQDTALEPILVSATRVATPDVEATYASEVHTRKQIEQSGAATLYDYLSQHSSVQVMPSYGNRVTQLINIRGYGIGDGHQNVVVSIDGQRLNNIDMVPQTLGTLPLMEIDRIEITKGSGSVLHGDGAMAGSIQIYTRPHQGVTVQTSAGNHGALNATIAAGLSTEKLSFSASADGSRLRGYSAPDATGKRDASQSDSLRMGVTFTPIDTLKLRFDAANSQIDTRYAGPLTQSQFDANPAQNGGKTYAHQTLDSEQWRLGGDFWLTPSLKLSATHGREDRRSRFLAPFVYGADYNNAFSDLALQYDAEALNLVVGAQQFDGERLGSSGRTTKNNLAVFVQGLYRLGKTSLSAGARSETVDYRYASTATTREDTHRLSGWDIGINRRIDDSLTLFANYNSAYQAPDVDRFFHWDGSFNTFIKPAQVRTLNAGFNHVTAANRLKVSAFRANLRDEIYYVAATFKNTNIDESHKYGFEIQDTLRITQALSASLNYAWTRAIIDRENEGGGAFNGKDLPGVPRHSVNLGANYAFNERSSLNLSQLWRSSAWVAEDFANNGPQRQRSFVSTNLSYRHRIEKKTELFASVENLFDRANGIWVRQDAIYPVNFSRSWRIGVRSSF